MAVHKDRLWAEFGSSAQRHGRMYAEFPRFVRRRRNYSALVALTTDDNRLAFQRWIKQFLNRNEEGVHVDVEVGAHDLW